MENSYQQFDMFQVSKKKLAFDLETEEFSNFGALDSVGITCAAALTEDGELTRWYGGQADGTHEPKMNADEVVQMIDYLAEKQKEGYQIYTWNGLSFDFQIVYGQSGRDERVKRIARSHVDMMFHFFCIKGFAISLEKTAQGMGLPGKPEGMDGSLAPGMWRDGKFEEVLDYVAQDVRVTLGLAQACEREKAVHWISKKGVPRSCPLPNGWLNVEESHMLPEADNSWMERPWERTRFTKWM